MTEDLQRAIFSEAMAADHKLNFYAELISCVAGFAQETIGDRAAILLLEGAAGSIADECETEH